MDNKFDVVIIGAGVIGNAVADLLSNYNLSIAVLDKEADTAFGISGRNSGVLHSGFNNPPGSLKAKLCVEGCKGFQKVADELGIEFVKTGKLIVATSEEEKLELLKLKNQGEMNSTEGLSIIGKDKIQAINGKIYGISGLLSGNSGIFNPFEYTIALANRACRNGVRYYFNNEVVKVETIPANCKKRESDEQTYSGTNGQERFHITAKVGKEASQEFYSGWLIDSAGMQSDKICRMLGIEDYEIVPKRGEYHVLDKRFLPDLKMPVYPVPKKESGVLGIHLTNTLSGNIMIGPSGENIEGKEDYQTTKSIMDRLLEEGSMFHGDIRKDYVIRSFSGVRPKLKQKVTGVDEDFVIEESKDIRGFIILAGIESPGMTSAIPIANMVLKVMGRSPETEVNEFHEEHCSEISDKSVSKIPNNAKLVPFEDKIEYAHSNIICRCEGISEGEILQAFDSILYISGIPTLRGIKNRTRAGMGRCQGGFCTNRIIKLLEKERKIDPVDMLLFNQDSPIIYGRLR